MAAMASFVGESRMKAVSFSSTSSRVAMSPACFFVSRFAMASRTSACLNSREPMTSRLRSVPLYPAFRAASVALPA